MVLFLCIIFSQRDIERHKLEQIAQKIGGIKGLQCSSSLGRGAKQEGKREREICSRREDEANQRDVVFIFTTHGA